jgi:NADPH2:quinone reductase
VVGDDERMTTPIPDTALQIQSTVEPDGTLHLSLASYEVPRPGPDQVLVRVEAAPINPSDLGLLLAGVDVTTAVASGTDTEPAVTATIAPSAFRALAARVGKSMTVGNEGAGVVVAAGSSDTAQALLGRTVAVLGGAMYSQYRSVNASQCLVLPEGTTPEQGASCFVNPLTALGMVGTMRMSHMWGEPHTALVHTAAASNLGQMLNRLCIEDGVPLVNVVRRAEQEELLRSQGAVHVCNSSSDTFMDDLTDALAATGATLAFDATGGGPLAGQILSCMEAAITRSSKEYHRYGSSTHKQVYIYGNLDRTPTELRRNFGAAWGVGSWLLIPFLQKVGDDEAARLRERVAAEVTTTFASTYTARVSLTEALRVDVIAAYAKQATGEKYLVTPHA